MKKTIIAVLAAGAVLGGGCDRRDSGLKKGDLLFRADGSDAISEAIQGVSDGYEGMRFSHAGILDIQGEDTTVIEAVFSGVRRTPLGEFLSHAAMREGRPAVLVERLRPPYDVLSASAVERASGFIGRPYDEAFLPDNDAYYCTELIQASYLDGGGNPLFASRPMTFRDNRTGEIPQAWTDFFEARGLDIPEGVPGTNPGDMAVDTVLYEVFRFY